MTEADLLESAALAESFSNHPISKSLRETCPGLDAKRASDAQEIAGHGVKTQVDGRTVLAGNARRDGKARGHPCACCSAGPEGHCCAARTDRHQARYLGREAAGSVQRQ